MEVEILVNDEILKNAVEVSGISDYNKIVEMSISQFIAMETQKKLKELKGKIQWTGNLDEMRSGDYANG